MMVGPVFYAKSMKLLILCLVSILSFNACLNCDSEKKGSESLKASSRSFIPYTDKQTIVFINQNNEELKFKVEKTEQTSPLCTKILCKGFNDPFKSAPCEFFETETISANLQTEDNTMIMSIVVAIDLFTAETTQFYDVLSTSLSRNTDFVEGRKALEAHFTKPTFDESKLAFAAVMKAESELLLNGKKYNNLLVAETSGNKIFIQEGQGIIGFKLNNDVYLAK